MSAISLITELKKRNLWAASAESCTGGLVAAAFTDVPGASDVFGYGVVTYSNEAKSQLLNVYKSTLMEFGAVSEQTASEMVSGLLKLSQADIALATTGIAGPGGGTEIKPVGLVYIAAGSRHGTDIRRFQFEGDRDAVRKASVQAVLELAEEHVKKYFP